MKILIIDDEKEICMLLSRMFRRRGFEVYNAHSFREGLKEREVDIVFLDIHLPDGNGIDLIPHILSSNEKVKIVIMSAYNTTDDIDKALSMGASKFISKPFKSEQVFGIIQETLTK